MTVTIEDTNHTIVSTDKLVFDNNSGHGIQVDKDDPSFGWHDQLGNILTPNKGSSKPAQAVFQGNIVSMLFNHSPPDEEYYTFHVPHDWLEGTDFHLHVHWGHNNASVTGGTVEFTYEITGIKSGGVYPTPVTGTITGTSTGAQYEHVLSETQVTASSPSASQLDTDDIEIDALIFCTISFTANNLTGATPDVFIFEVDLHYQSTGIPTKNKVSNFYT